MAFPQNLHILPLLDFPLISEAVVETTRRKKHFPTKVDIVNVQITRFW